MKKELIEQIAISLEMGGKQLSDAAREVIVLELQNYDENDVLVALQRCRREVAGQLSFAHIHQRIPGARPSANAAWSDLPRYESQSICWTKETAHAYGQVRQLLNAGDETGARLAFRDVYENLVREAEDRGEKVQWEFSGGTDPKEREEALKTAVSKGRISLEFAKRQMPQLGIKEEPMPVLKQLMPQESGLTRAFLEKPSFNTNVKKPYPVDENGEQLLDGRRGTIYDIPYDIDALYDRKNIRPYLRAVANYIGATEVLSWLPDLMGVPPEREE